MASKNGKVIAHHDGDAVARADAQRRQATRHLAHPLLKGRPAEPPPAAHQGA